MNALPGVRHYALMAVPLAFAGLPLYVFAPKFYADHHGLSLALMGGILIACRVLDAVQDPFFGWLSERFVRTHRARMGIIAAAGLGMAASFFLLFHPLTQGGMAAWFTVTMILTFSCYSVLLINYYALGAALTREYYAQGRLSAWREGAGLAGVLLASVLPVALAASMGEARAFDAMSAPLLALMIGALLALRRVKPESTPAPSSISLRGMVAALSGNRAFLALALVYCVNGIAASIPATLVLFYVDDVLHAQDYAGLFLALYFGTAALSMPIWTRLVRRFGKKRTWLYSMALAVASFLWAFMLGAGDGAWFALVCALSGLAFGADLALPPAMLTDTLKADEGSAHYFGAWAFIAKLSLALASGIGLLLLDVGGFFTLGVVYALVPCIFKLAAMVLLWHGVADKGER